VAARVALWTRRAVVRTAFGATVVAATAGALAPILGRRAAAGPVHTSAPPTERFTEMYRGRHIEGQVLSALVHDLRHTVLTHLSRAHAPGIPQVFIDGRPLHVMRCANGDFMSAVNHYESFPTLLAAARAAVDDLGAAQLSLTSAHTI
jgi:hypothetical protein